MRFARHATIGGGLCLVLAACGQERVEIIGGLPDAAPATTSCPAALAERLTVASIPVDRSIAWQKPGYDRFPIDERIGLAVQPNGHVQVAWLDVDPALLGASGLQHLHITPLQSDLTRRAADLELVGVRELAGLVAHDDGFALLVRGDNPGRSLDLGEGEPNDVAFLARYQSGRLQAEPLTGSTSLDAAQTGTLYSPFLDGQLVWNDSTYGAYFVVRGGASDATPGSYRDLLVFRDSFLRPAVWDVAHGCDNNYGIRLIPDTGKTNLVSATRPTIPPFTGLCVQQGRPSVKLTELEAARPVSPDEVRWPGYSGARLGSLVKVPGGYLVVWLSLGDSNDKQGHDIRMARLDESFAVTSGPTWFLRTPGREEWNLHVVPYGQSGNRYLMVYGEIAITGSALGNNAMFTGNFVGTHLVLIDANGTAVSANELVQRAPTTANSAPVVLAPTSDVGWAFVDPTPDYTGVIAGPNGAGQTTLHVAHLRYCP
jgi:hypothetical protein